MPPERRSPSSSRGHSKAIEQVIRQHRTSRAMEAVTIGFKDRQDERRTDRAPEELGEYDQQFQLAVSSDSLGPAVGRDNAKIDFPYDFVVAQGQRDNPYVLPTMTYGFELTSGDAPTVSCHVTKWYRSRNDGSIYAARVEIAVSNPGATEAGRFTGWLHLNFQGYASPRGDSRL